MSDRFDHDDEAVDEAVGEAADAADDGTDQQEPQPQEPEPGEPETTGNDVVDDVLASMRALDDQPVEEHVAVFEQAQDRLRGALDDPRDS